MCILVKVSDNPAWCGYTQIERHPSRHAKVPLVVRKLSLPGLATARLIAGIVRYIPQYSQRFSVPE
jgi:hypothetical protein